MENGGEWWGMVGNGECGDAIGEVSEKKVAKSCGSGQQRTRVEEMD